jgi:hypothetical protein
MASDNRSHSGSWFRLLCLVGGARYFFELNAGVNLALGRHSIVTVGADASK